MTIAICSFIVAFLVSVMLTPIVRKLGSRFGIIDRPGARRMNTVSIPRTGGIAIFIAFVGALSLLTAVHPDVAALFVKSYKLRGFLIGIVLVFGIGLADDIKRLGPWTKLIFQFGAVNLAYLAGLKTSAEVIFGLNITSPPIGYAVTVLWLLLFMNATNLVDGLDGLAGGIVFFTSVVMTLLSLLRGDLFLSVLFGTLSGAVFGFLRYNYFPASIFLGDGGSYLIGFSLAGLSIMGNVKTEVGAMTMILFAAFGLPIFDTIFSTIRRFLRGQKVFEPDKRHIHHKLKAMGFSTRKVVWIAYLTTFILAGSAMLLVNLRSFKAGMIILVVSSASILILKILGYFEYLGFLKNWILNLLDEMGFSRSRRSFLNVQVDIFKAGNQTEMWKHVSRAFEILKIEYGAVIYVFAKEKAVDDCHVHNHKPAWVYTQGPLDMDKLPNDHAFLKMEFPIFINGSHSPFGVLKIMKRVESEGLSPFTLQRIEHLRITIQDALERLRAGWWVYLENTPSNPEREVVLKSEKGK
jgi:UDP-GlcNAc:undecaprenyl-phosphate GlcNAc-1-phosphate transferase